MPARREFRGRDEVEVAVLDALVDRRQTGMTVFELRSHVDEDIETLEQALNNLRRDDLITVEYAEERSLIVPVDRVIPEETEDDEDHFFVALFRRVRRIITRR